MSAEELGGEVLSTRQQAEATLKRALEWQEFFDDPSNYDDPEEFHEQAVHELDNMYHMLDTQYI